jgi:hypothetical protein
MNLVRHYKLSTETDEEFEVDPAFSCTLYAHAQGGHFLSDAWAQVTTLFAPSTSCTRCGNIR